MAEVDIHAMKKFTAELEQRTRHLNDVRTAHFVLCRLLDAGIKQAQEAENTKSWWEQILGMLRFNNSAPAMDEPKTATVWLFTNDDYDKTYSFRGLDLKINRRIVEGLVDLFAQVAIEEDEELREFVKTGGMQNEDA